MDSIVVLLVITLSGGFMPSDSDKIPSELSLRVCMDKIQVEYGNTSDFTKIRCRGAKISPESVVEYDNTLQPDVNAGTINYKPGQIICDKLINNIKSSVEKGLLVLVQCADILKY